VINPPTTDVPAGDANSDTLLVSFGNGDGSPEGDLITVVSGSQVALRTTANFPAPPALGPFQWVAAAPAAATLGCALTLAPVTAVAAPNLTVAGTGAVDGGQLFNFGSNPRILAYAVRAGNLTFCDYLTANCGAACTAADGSCSANWIPIANNIVSLRAQYGRDTSIPMDGIIDTWDQTTPAQPSHRLPTRRFLPVCGQELLHCALHWSLATARWNVTQSPRRHPPGPAAPMIRSTSVPETIGKTTAIGCSRPSYRFATSPG
jgi:hypothetical protein